MICFLTQLIEDEGKGMRITPGVTVDSIKQTWDTKSSPEAEKIEYQTWLTDWLIYLRITIYSSVNDVSWTSTAKFYILSPFSLSPLSPSFFVFLFHLSKIVLPPDPSFDSLQLLRNQLYCQFCFSIPRDFILLAVSSFFLYSRGSSLWSKLIFNWWSCCLFPLMLFKIERGWEIKGKFLHSRHLLIIRGDGKRIKGLKTRWWKRGKGCSMNGNEMDPVWLRFLSWFQFSMGVWIRNHYFLSSLVSDLLTQYNLNALDWHDLLDSFSCQYQ